MFVACLFLIMLLYKGWDVVRGKRKSVIAVSKRKRAKKLINLSVIIVNEGQ